MKTSFSVESTSLADFFKAPRVVDLPEFQRGFAWTTKEVGQLLDDLLVAFSQGGDDAYFLGVILLLDHHAAAAPNAAAPSMIVDGQQRLTTLTIMLCVLRDLCSARGVQPPEPIERMIVCRASDGEQPRFRLALQGEAGRYLATHVQMSGATSKPPPSGSLSAGSTRIFAARDLVASTLSDRDVDEIAAFARFVADGTYAAVLATPDADHAHRAFTIINTHGVPLERSDLIKAELISALPPEDREAACHGWTKVLEAAGDDLDTFFGAIRTIEGNPRVPVVSGVREIVARCGGPLPFVQTVLVPYAGILSDVRAARHAGSPQSRYIERSLRHLGWLGSSEWVAPVLLFWQRHGHDAAALSSFLSALDRLLLALRILGLGADRRNTRLNAVLNWIRDSGDGDIDQGPLGLTREEQRSLLHHLRTPHKRSPMVCRQILLRLNDFLADDASAPAAPDELTVEHLLPQNPSRDSEWFAWFSKPDEREACIHSLGNLVLVPRELNNRARNLDLRRKLALFNGQESDAVPAITRQLGALEEWRPHQVREREAALIDLLAANWRLRMARTPAVKSAALSPKLDRLRRMRENGRPA